MSETCYWETSCWKKREVVWYETANLVKRYRFAVCCIRSDLDKLETGLMFTWTVVTFNLMSAPLPPAGKRCFFVYDTLCISCSWNTGSFEYTFQLWPLCCVGFFLCVLCIEEHKSRSYISTKAMTKKHILENVQCKWVNFGARHCKRAKPGNCKDREYLSMILQCSTLS